MMMRLFGKFAGRIPVVGRCWHWAASSERWLCFRIGETMRGLRLHIMSCMKDRSIMLSGPVLHLESSSSQQEVMDLSSSSS